MNRDRTITKALFVHAEWDEDARVWVATSDDVPGLATEAQTVEGLIAKLERMLPELLEANEGEAVADVPFELLTRRFSSARRHPA